MVKKNLFVGQIARSRTALAIVTATLLVGGTATEASAKSRHHHRHHHHHHAARDASEAATAQNGFWNNDWSQDSSQSAWRSAHASVMPTSGGHSFSGMASYYGNESGSRTASGQRMNANAMTCAHRSLPFGTRLRVTHGGQSVIVTVNDRGPFVRGRVLDLSTGAARAIGLTRSGVGRVTAEVVG
ncbi:septal ring lytic transglycosylase RlpA family protein [Bradyrhizobium sp. STM 3557]|uniref:septal ring lytic transglycosylase RlpA family protein n=1 Tax=Bradyrhizobium sp. STM 3557 TaxID=578920 RepID=UPI003890B6B6